MDQEITTGPDPGQAELIAQLEAILGCVPDAVVVYDAHGRIVRSNAAADALLGFSAGERATPIGERLVSTKTTWFREDGAAFEAEEMPALRAARYGETHRGIVVRMRRPGHDRWIALTAAPLVLRGEHVGAVVTLSDTTDRKRREANQALLAAVADDLARLSSEEELTRAIGARLAVHLDVTTCTVADFAGGTATVRSAFSRPGAVVAEGTQKVSDYLNEELQAAARAGKTVVVRDTRSDPRVDTGRYEEMAVRAGIIVPFQLGGEWRHSFAVGTPVARDWREDEVELVEEVAARFFPRIARARAEEALRESEERFRLLADAMAQIVCVLAPDGAAEHVSPSWTSYSGLDLAATRQAGWEGVLHPEDLPAAAACRLRALKALAPADVELRYRAADGNFRWFLSRLAPVVEGGRVVRFVGAAMDIEDRRHAEAALRESEQRFAVMFRRSPLAKALAKVPDGTVVDVSDAWVQLTGVPRDEALGKSSAQLGIFESAERGLFYEQALANGFAEGEARLAARGGKRVVFVRGEVVTIGGERHLLSAMYDVTDRKLAEEKLLQADRRKDEFLGMLSHELRNPLAPILNSLYILEHAEPTGDQARRAKEVARRQLSHLTRLVDDLLDVTRIVRGKVALRRFELDLAALARRTAEDHRAVMQGRRLDFVVDVPDAPVLVSGDETRLAQVLGNLLRNAAKFTPAGGRVTFTLRVDADRAFIHVADTGVGIPPGMLRSVFEPFTQAEQSLARSEGGLGLGLALVKGLVALHDGGVEAFSAGPGRGTDVVVDLPLVEPRAARKGRAVPARTEARTSSRRVLVVDDNRDAADSLAELVSMLGHRTDVAYDALDALAKAAAEVPDVVLCDIGLPGMDGYEFARQFRARSARRDVRLVAVSGYAQPEDVTRASEAGFDAHVAKPADPERISHLIEAGP